MGLLKEGIQLAKEALEISERLSHTAGQAQSWIQLAWLLWRDNQLDVAEQAASRAVGLLPEKGDQFQVCGSHRVLDKIYRSKDEA